MIPHKIVSTCTAALVKTLPILIFCVVCSTSADEQVIEIGTWGNFCAGAFTHTFDDNTPNQTAIAQPMFDAKGFNMTLFTITGSSQFPADWEKLQTASDSGHEIASHSVTHQPNQTMPVSELAASRNTIIDKISGEQCVTIAYPYCRKPSESEIAKSYIAGRACDGKIVPTTPPDFYGISSILTGGGNLTGAGNFNSKADEAVARKGWCVLLHHGVGNGDHVSSNTAVADIEGNLEYLDNNRDRIWVESFGNVVRYIKERDAAEITDITVTDDSCSFEITDNLPDSIYNYPLTCRFKKPDDWDTVEITQGDKHIADSLIMNNSIEYLQFNAIPDGGRISIRNAPVVANHSKSPSIRPENDIQLRHSERNLTVTLARSFSSRTTIRLLTPKGKTVTTFQLNGQTRKISVPLPSAASNVFIIEIITNGRTIMSRVLPHM